MKAECVASILAEATPLDPHSPQARAIADLFVTTLTICAGIFALVAILIVLSATRFRHRGPEPPAQIEGNRRLEIAWTAIPFAIVVAIFVLTLRAVHASDPPADREPDLVVTAHQWWWEVRYRSGAVTANEIHIPVATPLVVRIESGDVIHDFWVPDLGRKMDAIPGRSPTLWLEADVPGRYPGACAEYCGAQHAWMRIVVVAESAGDFAAWERRALEPAPPPAGDAATRGARVFREMTCIDCHAIGGVAQPEGRRPAAGVRVGPDLTHFAERSTLGAGVLANDAASLTRWLEDPQGVKPGSHMPNEQLGDARVADLVAYLGALR